MEGPPKTSRRRSGRVYGNLVAGQGGKMALPQLGSPGKEACDQRAGHADPPCPGAGDDRQIAGTCSDAERTPPFPLAETTQRRHR